MSVVLRVACLWATLTLAALATTRSMHVTASPFLNGYSRVAASIAQPGAPNPCQACYTGVMCMQCAGGCVRVGSICQPEAGRVDFERMPPPIAFSVWLQQQGRVYPSPAEHQHRFGIFQRNLAKIRAHNAAGKSYTLAVNEFADLTHEEFRARMQGDVAQRKQMLEERPSDATRVAFDASQVATPAPSVDWRNHNAITPIKNQLSCGCDYAFAAVSCIEAATALKTNRLISLSEQQIVDCSGAQQNQGCEGGGVDNSFKYVIANQGITTENEYPYNSEQGDCQQATSTAATVSSIVDVPADEASLLAAVNINPVAVYVDSSNEAFQFYSMGILDDPTCGTNVNHAMTVIGYGTDTQSGVDYWLLRNSWGTGWGQLGYAQFKRNVNQCGITTRMSYPTV